MCGLSGSPFATRSLLGIALGTVVLPSDAVHAQGKVDARYSVTLGGIPIGRGAWVIDIGEDRYTAAAHGTTAGVMRVFTSGHGTSASRGAVAGGQPVPASYASSVTTERRKEDIRMTLSATAVRDFAVDPPPQPDPERVPLTDAHRRGVSDPMTAALIRVPGSGDPLAPEACGRKLSVFDGRMRFDLQMAFKRMDQVRAEKGYEGRAVVCAVYFSPVAGYIPEPGGDQIPHRSAQHRGLAGAHRRHPPGCAVPHCDPDAARPRNPASDAVRFGRRAAAHGDAEDAVSSLLRSNPRNYLQCRRGGLDERPLDSRDDLCARRG